MAGNGAPLRAPGGLPSVIDVFPTVAFYNNDNAHQAQAFADQGLEVLMMVKFD
jgi:hypothetical protein